MAFGVVEPVLGAGYVTYNEGEEEDIKEEVVTHDARERRYKCINKAAGRNARSD